MLYLDFLHFGLLFVKAATANQKLILLACIRNLQVHHLWLNWHVKRHAHRLTQRTKNVMEGFSMK